MNPECCGQEMLEIDSDFENELGETEVVGYECKICGRTLNSTRSEI